MRGTDPSSHWRISDPHAPTHQFASTKPKGSSGECAVLLITCPPPLGQLYSSCPQRTASGLGCVGFLSLFWHQSSATKICYVSIAWSTMFWCSLNEIKANIRIYNVYQPALVECAHITIFGVSPGLRCHKTHWKVVFLVLIRWFNDILFFPYFKIGEYIGILSVKIVCKQLKMAQSHCQQHFEINRLSLKISGNNIVYRNPWY